MLAQGIFAPPASLLMLMFLGLIVTPITLYLYAAHPAWTWMYFVNPDKIPGFALIPLVAGHCITVILGWFIGGKLIFAGKQNWVRNAVIALAVFLLLGGLLFWGRLTEYGTYTEFHEGRALDLMDVKLGYVLVALGLGTVASAVYLSAELLRDSRRVRSL